MSDNDASIHHFVGIDLSVLNSVVSYSTKTEPTAVTVAVNDVSNRSTPSTVGFDGSLRLVGDAADAKVSQLPKMVVNFVPAVLGTSESARASWTRFGCLWGLTDDNRIGPLSFGNREELMLQPASCLAALLAKLVTFVVGPSILEPASQEEGAKQNFELAISVPDVWSEAERSTLCTAVHILGWQPELVNVLPYSAALATAYAQRMGQRLSEGEERRVVGFVDVGYSQTTVSIAAFSAPNPTEGPETQDLNVELCSSATAPTLGVQTLCMKLFEHITSKQEQTGSEQVALASKRGARLMTALQKAVKELSMLPDTNLALECFYPDESDLKVALSRTLFEDIIKSQTEELTALVRKALSDAGVAAEDVHSVELVGGGMRIPKVQVLLSEIFPDMGGTEGTEDGTKTISKRLRFGLDGTSAVATGAAHYAAGRRAVKMSWNFAGQKTIFSDDAELGTCREVEAWMAKINADEVLRLQKSNELESMMYEVRGWLDGPDRALLKPEMITPILDETARWFEDAQYDDSITLAMYEEKLGGLKQQLEEHGSEYFEKKRREKEEKEKELNEQAEKERQRRHDLGMDADKDDRKMAKSERLKMAGKNKEEGNTVFKAGNLEDAAARYQRAQQHLTKYYMLDLSPEEKAEGDAVTLSVQLNLAQVYLKLATQTEKDQGKEKAEAIYKKVTASTDEALKVDPENVKAKFRKATALEKLGDLDAASKEVKSALKLDPENSDLVKFKERLDKLHAAQTAKAKKMYGKMFG